ncbi:MAG TPA: tRNA epoxyqueuosine(34) reductase QueG [Tepidisphaeraceae bacterium]|jgi:epoxyqueuosine reductase
MDSNLHIAQQIKEQARQLGFDLVGITQTAPSQRSDYFRQWLDNNQQGSMRWMQERFAERTDPRVYMPAAKSIICVGMNYYVPLNQETRREDQGRIARYALGDDYHELIKSRLHTLADWMRNRWPGTETRACVDTAPLLEKDLAARAGLGWIGKHTCVINETIGSWFFLGEVLTSLELPPDAPATDHCGTCTRCIDACPTQAITAPYQLDARRCISYLTIEHRDEIDPSLQGQIGDWLYGCDICEDVCPHNRDPAHSSEPAFASRFGGAHLTPNQVLNWTSDEYRATLRNSAMKRVKLPILQRNAKIVLSNSNGS